MAAPNIINLSSITGNTDFANVTTVSSNVLVNPAASGKVFKLNTVIAASIDPANATEVTVSIFRAGVENKLANSIVVPARSSLIAVSRDVQVYLQEGDALRMSALANNDIWATVSYEVMA